MIAFQATPTSPSAEEAYGQFFPAKVGETFVWRYARHPSGSAGIIGFAREDDLSVVGMTPFIPATIQIDGRAVRAFQAIDTIVSEAARGKGVFTKLGETTMAAAQDQGAGAVYGFPNAAAAKGWFEKLGWSNMGTAPFLFKPLRFGYFTKRLLGRRLFDVPLSFGRPSRRDVEEISRFDAQFDEIWSEFSAGIKCSLQRDSRYLNWRLAEHPTAKYKTLAIRGNGRILAFVGYRVTEKHGGRVGYIMEAICRGGQKPALDRLLKIAVSELHAMRSDIVLAWCFRHSPNHGVFSKNAFFQMPNSIRPHEINFGSRDFGSPSGSPLTMRENWYLSYLDSDTV